MLVDALTKHIADFTVLKEFFNSKYLLQEDPALEDKREKLRADRKKKTTSS